LPPWAGSDLTWAPGVLQFGKSFIMFYTAEFGTSGKQCISAAVSSTPEGPFVDNSALPIVCQLTLGGSIDPSPFVDPNGSVYLDWKSEGAGSKPPTIWGQQLGGSGTQLVGSPVALLTPSQPWEEGIVEAPDMFWIDGQRALFYSGGQWQTPAYAIGLAVCAGPLTPCTKPLDKPLFSTQGDIVGPGGPTAFWSVSGAPELAFAAWLPGQVGYPHSRDLYIRPLQIVGGLPTVCASPTTTAQGPACPGPTAGTG